MVSRLHWTRRPSGPALWTALGDPWWSNGVSLPCSPSLEVIGNVFDLCWQSGKSAEHRQHKANGVFRRWAPVLTNLSLPISERMNAFRVSVAPSALWLVAGHSQKHSQASLVLDPPACCVEWFPADAGQTNLLLIIGVAGTERDVLWQNSLVWISRNSVFCGSVAGRVARLQPDSLAHRTLTTRDLAWWRHAQAAHAQIERQMGRCPQ